MAGEHCRAAPLPPPNAPAEELLDAVNILLELRQAERSASLERELFSVTSRLHGRRTL